MATGTPFKSPPTPDMIAAGVGALRAWGDPRRLIDKGHAEQAITVIWNAMAAAVAHPVDEVASESPALRTASA